MDDRDMLEQIEVNYDDSSPNIKEVLEKVLMNMKDGKATWFDGIPAVLVMNLCTDKHKSLYEIINYKKLW